MGRVDAGGDSGDSMKNGFNAAMQQFSNEQCTTGPKIIVNCLLLNCCIVALIWLSMLAPSAHGWGLTGHQIATDRATRLLPTKMQDFYWMNRAVLAEWCIEPDVRKDSDISEGPKHYIDLEQYPPNPPHLTDDAIRKLGMEKMQKSGWAPWNTQLVYQDLVRAFQNKNYPRILKLSGELSHYVADLHVPLHTTENYDGQLSSDFGVHARWESRMVDQFPEVLPFEPVAAEKIQSAPERIWSIVNSSSPEVPGVLAGDRKNAYPDSAVDGYSVVKSRQTFGPVAARRMNAAAHEIASFWYTAWVAAGRPRLPATDLSTIAMPAKLPGGEALFYEGRFTSEFPPVWPSEIRTVLTASADVLNRIESLRMIKFEWARTWRMTIKLAVLDASGPWDKAGLQAKLEKIGKENSVTIRVE